MKSFQILTGNPAFRTRVAPLIVSLTLLFSVVIIAATPPAPGYELSVYEAFSPLLWVLFAVTVFFSIYTILQSCDREPLNLFYGYFSVLLVETIVFFLPLIRGYYAMNRGSGDLYYHMFVAHQIVNSGYVSVADIYPIMHIWLSIFFTYLPDFMISIVILSVAFFVLYILSLYILGKTIVGTRKGGVLVSVFGTPLIFSSLHNGFVPFFFALLTFPLILYAYHKIRNYPVQKNRFYICLVILSLFIVFCHPMISVFLLVMFLIFTFFEVLKGWVTARHSNIEAANILIIVSLTLTLWWLQNSQALDSLQTIADALFEQGSHISIFEHQMTAVSTSNASVWLVINRFLEVYGPICLYFSISLLFLCYLTYQYFKNNALYETDFIYSIQFCAAVCIGIVLMTGYFVIAEPIRAASYGLVFATILCGLFAYHERRRWGLIPLVTVILTGVCVMSLLTLYTSPWTGGTNTALTWGDKSGNDWILEYRSTEIPVVKEELSNSKYAVYFFEITDLSNFQNLSEYTLYRNLNKYTQIIPSDFGYRTNRTIADSFAYLPEKEMYLMTTELMRVAPYALPEERRNQAKSFTDADFTHLKNDPTVDLVYSGADNFGVWKIALP